MMSINKIREEKDDDINRAGKATYVSTTGRESSIDVNFVRNQIYVVKPTRSIKTFLFVDITMSCAIDQKFLTSKRS